MKPFIWAGVAVAGLVLIFFVLHARLNPEKQAEHLIEETMFEPYRAALSGEYLCLPHIEFGAQTDECAFGIKTDTGAYYAVDFALMSQIPPTLAVGDRFSARGVIVPIERLSTDHWRQYPIEGIFSVTDSVVKEGAITLAGSSFAWVRTEYATGTTLQAPRGERFVLSFANDGRVTSTTDCNSLSGTFVESGEVLSMGSFSSTKMYCEGSRESEYVRDLALTTSYSLEDDTLRLNLNRDVGIMVFTRTTPVLP